MKNKKSKATFFRMNQQAILIHVNGAKSQCENFDELACKIVN